MHKHKQLYSNTSNGIHTHTQMFSLWLDSRLMVFGFVSVFGVSKSFEWWKLFSFYSLLMASGFNSTWSFVFMFYGSHIEWMLMLAQSVSRTSWNQWTSPFSANTGRNRLELFISFFFCVECSFWSILNIYNLCCYYLRPGKEQQKQQQYHLKGDMIITLKMRLGNNKISLTSCSLRN